MRFIPGLQIFANLLRTKKSANWSALQLSVFHSGLNESEMSASSKTQPSTTLMLCGLFLDEDPISVYAKMGSMRIKNFEDYAQIMLTYKDGKSAFIESNWLTPYKTRSLTVTGSDAIMRLDYITQDLWIEQQTQTVQPRYPIPRTPKSRTATLCRLHCGEEKTHRNRRRRRESPNSRHSSN